MDVSENGVCPQNCIFYANMMINEWILGVPCFQTKPHALQKLRLKGHAKDIKGFFWSKMIQACQRISTIFNVLHLLWQGLRTLLWQGLRTSTTPGLPARRTRGVFWCSQLQQVTAVVLQDLQLIAQLETDVQAKSAQITKRRTQPWHCSWTGLEWQWLEANVTRWLDLAWTWIAKLTHVDTIVFIWSPHKHRTVTDMTAQFSQVVGWHAVLQAGAGQSWAELQQGQFNCCQIGHVSLAKQCSYIMASQGSGAAP